MVLFKFNLLSQAIALCVCTAATLQACQSVSSQNPSQPSIAVKSYASPEKNTRIQVKTTRIQVKNLPRPFATESASQRVQIVSRPQNSGLQVPQGFIAKLFAQGLSRPRWLMVAPNGDVFLSESYDNRIRLLRDTNSDGVAEVNAVFASGLNQPLGMAISPDRKSFYVANTDAVVRYPYQLGQTQLQGKPTLVTPLTGGGYNQHWTRNLIFSPDGKKLYVSVGSASNADPEEPPRATIQVMNPDGSDRRTFASGLRNPVGLSFNPITQLLYTTVNERDGLGDDLVPDYLTSVQPGGFYGWPYSYLGSNPDPRLPRKPELERRAIVPEVLFQAHSAALGLVFYTAKQFPKPYQNNAFVAFRGSWNRAEATGYKVVRVPFNLQGKADGSYEDFVTGWLVDNKKPTAWGRPVGLAIAQDGSLLITDEPGGTIWRVAYTKPSPSP
jgi:glucose/arabinose dehydrogenase